MATALAAVSPVAAPAASDGRGEGTQDRQWVNGPADPPATISQPDHVFTTQPVQIPMRDGVELTGVLFEPLGLPVDEPRACVLWNEGYVPPSPLVAVTGAAALPRLQDLARRGYAGLYVHLRGPSDTPDGEGLYHRYAEDGYDAVEWAAAQPWCDNVGMIGGSLNGISAWLAGSLRPPHLRAIAPEIACGDCYWYLWNRGGTLPGAGREARTPPLMATDEYGAASAHRTYDAWWEERNTTTSEHEAMADAGIAVMQCGAWDDYINPGGMRAIEELTAGGGTGMNLVGPCSHGGSTQEALLGLVAPEPALEPYDYQTFTVLWLDRWLKGIDNGYDAEPQALIWVEGPDQYRYEPTWPPADTHWTRLHLRAEASGSAGHSLHDGSLSVSRPGGKEPSFSYTHDPDGYLNDAGGGTARPRDDQRPDEAHSPTWTSPALEVPTEITGWPRLEFWASSTAPDTDFVAEITEVTPDGTSTVISRGWLNAPQSFSRADPEPLEPGRIYRFELELWPLAHVVQPGNRIRVALSGSDSPGTGVNPAHSTVTIHQDAAHPSVLSLPVIGTGWRSLEARRPAG